jgi:hypothetical protein
MRRKGANALPEKDLRIDKKFEKKQEKHLQKTVSGGYNRQ